MINTLLIRNFRLFKELRVEKLARVNLFVGKNNSGKSCLLEALRIYTSGADASMLSETEELIDKEKGKGTFYHVLVKACSDKAGEMKEKRKQIIRCLLDNGKLKLDRPTVLCLLNFELDTENEANQALELEAFKSLRKQDYGKLRELVVGVVESPPDEIIGLNAVYVFKYIN